MVRTWKTNLKPGTMIPQAGHLALSSLQGVEVPEVSKTPMRVLVVDDSRVFQRIIRRELEAGGYQVDTVGDGAAGLEAL